MLALKLHLQSYKRRGESLYRLATGYTVHTQREREREREVQNTKIKTKRSLVAEKSPDILYYEEFYAQKTNEVCQMSHYSTVYLFS